MEDIDELRSIKVRAAGRQIDGAWDRLARYCGLDWSGGTNETWAFRYYDATPNPTGRLSRIDMLAAAALHPQITRDDLRFFHDERRTLQLWIDDIDRELGLGGARAEHLRHLAEMATWDVPVNFSLLTKVLHRTRPRMIPLVDRHTLDWYRPITGERSARKAWPALLQAINDDIDIYNALALVRLAKGIQDATFERVSSLRLLDIVIWMTNE